MAAPAAVLSILVNANTAQATAAVGRMQGQLVAADKTAGKTGKSVGKAGALMKGGGLLAAAGAGVAFVAIKGFVGAAKESQVSQKRMQTQLKALGISYKDHAGQIDSVIQKHSRLSGLDDEELQDSFTNIVRVTKDVNKALKLNALAADIARARGISLEAASKAISKAAGGQAGALGRLGVVVKKGATGQEALAEAQKKYAGQAEAYGKTATGAQERLGVAVENLQEKFGKFLLPIIAKVATAVAKFVEGMETGTGAGGKFAAIMGDIFKVVGTVATIVFEVNKVFWGFVITIAKAEIEIGKAIYEIGATIFGLVKSVGETIGKIVTFFIDLPGKIIAAVTAGAEAIKGVGGDIVGWILSGLKAVTGFATSIGEWVRDKLKGVATVVTDLAGAAKALGGDVIGWVVDGVKAVGGIATEIGTFLKEKLEGVVNVVAGIASAAKSIGSSIGGWIVGGIKGALNIGSDLANIIIRAINTAIRFINDKLPDSIGIGPAKINLPDLPTIPTLHTGTSYFVPPGGGSEGLALLARGEQVIPVGGAGGASGATIGEVTINNYGGEMDESRIANLLAWRIETAAV